MCWRWWHKRSKHNIRFAWEIGQVMLKRRIPMLELNLTNEQKVNVTIHPVTLTGKPATLDGAPSWTVLNGGATLEVAEDGLSAEIITSDTDLSDSTIQVSADADLGEGVEAISDTVLLHTKHANAANLGLVAGEPEAK